ncbi:MAG: DUF3500 domain-containing protein [Caldilineaceae bacterium SB0670_bin_27]|nr:DUF3500 domain-containing protein [Caldilineaceae bacterium SB0670_bin_27]
MCWSRFQCTVSSDVLGRERRAVLFLSSRGHGPSDCDGAIYYRIHSPVLIIEILTRGPVGASNGHYHSTYRDPTNEYGQQR